MNSGVKTTEDEDKGEPFHRWLQALAPEDPVPGCFGSGYPESGEREMGFLDISRERKRTKRHWPV